MANNDETAEPSIYSGRCTAHALRVGEDADLVETILSSARKAMAFTNSNSAFIMTAVGSLKEVSLRMASASCEDGKKTTSIRTWNENVEIVSLVGTITNDNKHLHMTISKADGSTAGGHVVSGKIYTTLELVLGTIEGVSFKREMVVRVTMSWLFLKSQGLTRKTNPLQMLCSSYHYLNVR